MHLDVIILLFISFFAARFQLISRVHQISSIFKSHTFIHGMNFPVRFYADFTWDYFVRNRNDTLTVLYFFSPLAGRLSFHCMYDVCISYTRQIVLYIGFNEWRRSSLSFIATWCVQWIRNEVLCSWSKFLLDAHARILISIIENSVGHTWADWLDSF